MEKIAEIVEAGTTEFCAQCYELYCLPELGALVRTVAGAYDLYGIVYNATTAGIEPGRRPIARGKNETSEEDIYRSNPQLYSLLRTEFNALVVGHREDRSIRHYLPPTPAHIHSFVYPCSSEEVREFSQSLGFLNVLLTTRLPIPLEEVAGAALRRMSTAHDDPRQFLVAAGKEISIALGNDFNRLRVVLEKIRP